MPGRYKICTQVSPECPASDTTLGYAPNLGVNIFFAVVYAICAIFTLGIGLWKRTWAFGIVVAFGFGLETVGYVGRIMLHYNAWSPPGFKMDLVCIILAPTLICAGMYLTLKHVARTVGPNFSRITPRLYTWIFIPFDIFCLVLQGVGGGVDSVASDSTPINMSELKTGDNIMIAGIALQVVNLAVFGLFSLDFFLAARKYFHDPSSKVRDSPSAQIWYSRRFRIFCTVVTCCYAGILIRCIYRIAEMAGGWGNHIMQNEPLFYVLEGAMVLYPAILFTLFPPGIWFPEMGTRPGPLAITVETTASDESGNMPGSGEEYRMMTSEEAVEASK